MIHHIQRAILDSLATCERARYGELKPQNLDGNIFTYHLKQLITDRYVVKNDDGSYSLLPKGKEYLVHRYEDSSQQAHSIFLIAIQQGDQWLMRERLVQPLLGMAGFIHGEPVANEPLLDTAQRRLLEKTGLSTPLHIFSSGLIKITRNDIIESFSHAIILTAQTDEDFNISEDQTGRQFWQSSDALSQSSILPSCSDIVVRIAAGDNSTFVLEYNL